MTPLIAINIAIWLLMLLLIAFTKWDYGVIAIGIMMLLVLTGCLDADTALSKFADTNVIMMATMMIVAKGFGKTRLVGNIASLLFKVSGTFENCLRLFMIIAFALGFVLSGAIGRIAIVYPIILAICENSGKSPSKAMFPIGIMMLCDQTGFPMGGPAITYAKYNGFLESAGYTYGDSFSIFEPFIARVPICIIMLVYFMTIGIKIAPDTPPVPLKSLELKARGTESQLDHKREVLAYSIFILVCVGLITADFIGIPQWMCTTCGAVLMYLTGVLTFKEGVNAIPFSLVWLFIGALAMGTALLQTGTGHLIGSLIAGALGEHPSSFVLYMAFWLVTMFLTQFMNNGATANMLIPIAILTCNTIGCSAKGVIMAVQNASLTSWFLPSATAVIPILMEGGGYNIKSLLKQGWPPALIKTVCSVAWLAFMFPAWA